MSVRLAVDAGNFARDRRGMGRVARGIALAALADPRFTVSLLVEHGKDADGVRAAFAGTPVSVRPAATAAAAGAYDAAWFPWNGMRYDCAAPALLTIHDVFAFTEPHPERVAREREQRPIARGAARADRIATVSQWSKGEIVRELGVAPDRISVVEPAPDPLFFPASGDLYMAAWRYALLVGTREARKNAGVVVDACAQALDGPRDLLVVAGSVTKDMSRRLEPLGDRVRLAGEVDDLRLRSLYRNARAVCMPSTAEGFGLVAVEALACGAPVLAANAAALPEATGGAAMLVDPHDPGAWRDALRAVFADDALAAALAARGAARFAHASRERPARTYLEMFKRLAGAAAA